MSIINPYNAVDFDNFNRILGVTHAHMKHNPYIYISGEITNDAVNPQTSFNTLYNSGVRHFAISRYRPSIVTYPYDYTNHTFTYVSNQFDSTLPLNELKTFYGKTIDFSNHDDVIGCPNAEHVYPKLWKDSSGEYKWTIQTNLHLNGLGSMFESGTIPNNGTGKRSSGYGGTVPTSQWLTYPDLIDSIVDNLLYEDGGGVIINHAQYTENKTIDTLNYIDITRFVMDCLDYNNKVLGTDLLESAGQLRFESTSARADTILSTGRRCWLFSQGDWTLDRGFNEILLPSNLTSKEEFEHECLKSYRNGRFFGRYANSDLSITNLELTPSSSGHVFSISAHHVDQIDVIVDGVTSTFVAGENLVINNNIGTVEVNIPSTAIYVRAVVYTFVDNDPNWNYKYDPEIKYDYRYKDLVFTNPIMINPSTYSYDPLYDNINPPPGPEPDPDPGDDPEEDPDEGDTYKKNSLLKIFFG